MSKSLDDWLCHINTTHHKEVDLTLDRLREVMLNMALYPVCPVITVGGTNGKGSTCAMLEAIYTNAGYEVGLFSSPHLIRFNERIRVANKDANDEDIISAFEKIELARKTVSLTYFEFSFLAALNIFLQQDLDLIILEVGLGGRLDAANVLDPICAIVTNVGLDHMEFLGDNREAIGEEKAAIFRGDGALSICGDEDPPQSIIDVSAEVGTNLQLVSRDFGFIKASPGWTFWSNSGVRMSLSPPRLQGEHQLINASVAIEAVTRLKIHLPIDAASIRSGLLDAERLGRFQVLPARPLILLDVAHNVASVMALVNELKRASYKGKTRLVFGALADKQYVKMLSLMEPVVDRILVCGLPDKRSVAPDIVLSQIAPHFIAGKVISCDSVAQAIDQSLEESDLDDRIIVCGSFITVTAALNHPFVSSLVHNSNK
ncbi:MAG: bifunctional folylpolyglutamate synthase/dihydrofolate synthase [Betaproteobacteria bacterium]|nr:bifunctional folylpolyglutamate synthase/dihydrofolate synthase [Betaproteobacteria bacterium]